jgi:hypothetical protein
MFESTSALYGAKIQNFANPCSQVSRLPHWFRIGFQLMFIWPTPGVAFLILTDPNCKWKLGEVFAIHWDRQGELHLSLDPQTYVQTTYLILFKKDSFFFFQMSRLTKVQSIRSRTVW